MGSISISSPSGCTPFFFSSLAKSPKSFIGRSHLLLGRRRRRSRGRAAHLPLPLFLAINVLPAIPVPVAPRSASRFGLSPPWAVVRASSLSLLALLAALWG